MYITKAAILLFCLNCCTSSYTVLWQTSTVLLPHLQSFSHPPFIKCFTKGLYIDSCRDKLLVCNAMETVGRMSCLYIYIYTTTLYIPLAGVWRVMGLYHSGLWPLRRAAPPCLIYRIGTSPVETCVLERHTIVLILWNIYKEKLNPFKNKIIF